MTYNLNLIPGKVPVAVHVKQYDTGLREITFNLYYGDTAYSVPYNSTITVSGTKPDGNGFSYNVTQFSGSAVTVPMQEQMTVLAGEFPCQLTIANSGEIIGTASFLLCVEPAALSSDTPVSDTDLAMFQQLANQTQTEAAGVANATAQIAENTQNIATNTAAITELNGNLTVQRFSLTLSSDITDAYVRSNFGYYIPALKMGVIKLFVISNAGLIPIQNSTIATIPSSFRPALTMDVGYAILTSKSESGWQPANYEVLGITNAGEIRLGNFIHGAAVKSIAIDTVYYTGT